MTFFHDAIATRANRHGLPVTGEGVAMILRFADEAGFCREDQRLRDCELRGRGTLHQTTTDRSE